MLHDYVLETERLLLRSPNMDDAPAIHEWVKERDVAINTLNIPHPYPENGVTEWLEGMAERVAAGEMSYMFAITRQSDNIYMGTIAIHPNERFNRAEIGYWIGIPYWGQGYATEAAKRIVQFGFEERQLNRIFATYFTENPASRRVMDKIGMTFEGILRQHVQRDGVYRDLGYCGILREEWEG